MPPGCEFAWAAFWRLHADRPMMTVGYSMPMGATIIESRPGRIPFSVIDLYARRLGIEGSDFDMLLGLIGMLDNEYITWHAEKVRERAEQK